MEQAELLAYVGRRLEELGIRYFVTGSYAGILYGEFRMTNDIDIVIDLRMEQVEGFLGLFPTNEFYVDADTVRDAVRTRFQFNVIHMTSVAKVDFIVVGASPHDYQRFDRVRRIGIAEAATAGIVYCAPEDLILKKLEFHRESASEKHLRDVVGILKKSGAELDWEYLAQWVPRLGVNASWELARQAARTDNHR